MSDLEKRTKIQIVFDSDESYLKEAIAKSVAACRLFESVALPIQKKRKALADKFRALKNKEYEDSGKPYTDGYMTKYGITLTIDADHPNDRVIDDFGWDEIEEILPNDEELRSILWAY